MTQLLLRIHGWKSHICKSSVWNFDYWKNYKLCRYWTLRAGKGKFMYLICAKPDLSLLTNGAALKSLLLSDKTIVKNLLMKERPVLKSLLMGIGTGLKNPLLRNVTASKYSWYNSVNDQELDYPYTLYFYFWF